MTNGFKKMLEVVRRVGLRFASGARAIQLRHKRHFDDEFGPVAEAIGADFRMLTRERQLYTWSTRVNSATSNLGRKGLLTSGLSR